MDKRVMSSTTEDVLSEVRRQIEEILKEDETDSRLRRMILRLELLAKRVEAFAASSAAESNGRMPPAREAPSPAPHPTDHPQQTDKLLWFAENSARFGDDLAGQSAAFREAFGTDDEVYKAMFSRFLAQPNCHRTRALKIMVAWFEKYWNKHVADREEFKEVFKKTFMVDEGVYNVTLSRVMNRRAFPPLIREEGIFEIPSYGRPTTTGAELGSSAAGRPV